MKLRLHVAALSLLSLLSACATSPDPSQGGFISGVAGLVSGGYEQRVTSQSTELQQMRAEQAEAQNQAYQARAELSTRQQELSDLRRNVAGLERSLSNVQARAAQQRATNVALSDRDRKLMNDLQQAQTRLTSLQQQLRSSTATTADLEATKQEYLSLQAAIAALSEQLKGGRSEWPVGALT